MYRVSNWWSIHILNAYLAQINYFGIKIISGDKRRETSSRMISFWDEDMWNNEGMNKTHIPKCLYINNLFNNI